MAEKKLKEKKDDSEEEEEVVEKGEEPEPEPIEEEAPAQKKTISFKDRKSDTEEGKTVFVRNISFDVTEEDM